MNKSTRLLLVKLTLILFPTLVFADNVIEENFSCVGTEPFWGLKMAADDGVVYQVQFSVLGSNNFEYKADSLVTHVSANTASVFFVGSIDSNFSAFVERKGNWESECNDGMSDRMYPYLIHVKVGSKVYSGCCASNIYPARDEHNRP